MIWLFWCTLGTLIVCYQQNIRTIEGISAIFLLHFLLYLFGLVFVDQPTCLVLRDVPCYEEAITSA